VAVGFIYFLTTQFELDWSRTWDNLRGLDPRLYAAALAVYYLSLTIRGIRWRLLAHNAGLDSAPDSELPSTPRFAQLILIGWFLNSTAGFRSGDAYRAYALSVDTNTEFSPGLGIVLAERVIDMLTVLALTVASVGWYSSTRGSSDTWYIAWASLLMALVLGTMLAVLKGYGPRLARFLPGRFEQAYTRFQEGALGSLKQLRAVFALSLASWFLEAARLYIIVHALDISVPLPLLLVVSLGQAMLSVVPFTPGGVGFVEPGAITLLALSLSPSAAVSVVVVDRTITLLSVIAFGGLAFLLYHAARARSGRPGSADRVALDAAPEPPS
jgi:uncharacterized protein (TIRG00374 family)